MDIKYLGHSSFKLKGKEGAVVTDPFDSVMVGLPFSKVSAEVVTVSHDHNDHNQASKIGGTVARENPFVITQPGEYEINGVGVVGVSTWHDDKKGGERGPNNVYVIQLDGVLVAHLGDLGHVLSDRQVSEIGPVDVLLVPVGGHFTIGPADALKVIDQLSPSLVVPMHYKMEGMASGFDELVTVDEFLEKAGAGEARREEKLSVSKTGLPDEMEIVVLSSQ